MSIELLKDGDHLLGMVVRKSFNKPGASFLTDPQLELQVAVMIHPTGKLIVPHLHKRQERKTTTTSEVLLIKKGKLKVNLYSENSIFLFDLILTAGDLVLLINGGHGFEVLEDIEMIEVKQGPFVGETDKIRFTNVELPPK